MEEPHASFHQLHYKTAKKTLVSEAAQGSVESFSSSVGSEWKRAEHRAHPTSRPNVDILSSIHFVPGGAALSAFDYTEGTFLFIYGLLLFYGLLLLLSGFPIRFSEDA